MLILSLDKVHLIEVEYLLHVSSSKKVIATLENNIVVGGPTEVHVHPQRDKILFAVSGAHTYVDYGLPC